MGKILCIFYLTCHSAINHYFFYREYFYDWYLYPSFHYFHFIRVALCTFRGYSTARCLSRFGDGCFQVDGYIDTSLFVKLWSICTFMYNTSRRKLILRATK